MNKLIFYVGIMLSFVSCQSEEEKTAIKIEFIVRDYILREKGIDGSLEKADSIWIHRVDTLTDLFDSVRIQSALLQTASLEQSSLKLMLSLIESYHSSARTKNSQARLYASMFGADDILTIEQNRHAKDDINKAKEELAKIDNKKKIIDQLLSRARTIDSLRNNRLIDSAAFRGYVAIFGYRGADSLNREVRLDTANIKLSKDFRILPYLAAGI